jgi:hypothetical protein
VLTLFAFPKRFQGHIGIIQRNAITSWTLLRPQPEVILCGSEPGTAEICQELGLRHLPEVATTALGAPLLSDLFENARRAARFDLLAYVNSDIILLSDFLEALQKVTAEKREFLMVGRRWDTPIAAPLDFSNPDWESSLRADVARNGIQPPPPGNSDYFVFPRHLWKTIAPIAIGRAGVDPWLVYEARRRRASVIDASTTVLAVHQNHEQSPNPQRLRQWRRETTVNQQLVGKEVCKFCLWDATHLLTSQGLVRPRGLRYFIRRVDTLHLFHPILAAPLKIPRLAAAAVRRFLEKRAVARNPSLRLTKLVESKTPAEGICAILGLAVGSNGHATSQANGLQLAYALTRAGSPVAVYDPGETAMKDARHLLGGPIQFAASAEDCVHDADVIVITAANDEFRNISSTMSTGTARPRTLIDCCGAFSAETRPAGIEYVGWTSLPD